MSLDVLRRQRMIIIDPVLDPTVVAAVRSLLVTAALASTNASKTQAKIPLLSQVRSATKNDM